MLNNNYYLEEKIILEPKTTTNIRVHCIPESNFSLDLLLEDNTFVRVNVNVRDYSSDMCSIYDGLIAAYDMKTIDGDNLIDISGNGLSGKIPAGVSVTEKGLTDNDGVHKGVFLNSSPIINTDTYTIVARIKLNSASNDDRVFFGNGNSTSNLIIDSLGVRDKKLSWNYDSAGNYKEGGTKVLDVGVWHTIAFVSDGGRTGNIKIYVNGVEDDITTTNFYRSGSNSNLFDRSHSSVSNPFLGSINDFKIYDRVLSEDEIKNYHNYFEKRITLRENFNKENVESNVVPTNWTKTSGVFNIGEINIEKENLVINGNFENGVNNWNTWQSDIYPESDIFYSNNSSAKIIVKSGFTSGAMFQNTSGYEIGKRYKFTAMVKKGENISQYRTYFSNTGASMLPNITNNIIDNDWKLVERYFIYDGNNTQINITPVGSEASLYVDAVSIRETEPIPTIKDGIKYLTLASEYDLSNVISTTSKQAYGTWEFDLYYTGGFGYVHFINDDPTHNRDNSTGYTFVYNGGGGTQNNILLRKYTSGSPSNIYSSSFNVLTQNVWYRIRITRNQIGSFNIFFKGGEYGDEWYKLNDSLIIDNTYKTSNSFSISGMRVGDKITNLLFIEGIPVD